MVIFPTAPAHLPPSHRRQQTGVLITEAVMGMALLIGVVFLLVLSFAGELKLYRLYYHQAIAMEIVDGEMEILAAGEWQSFGPGTHEYPVRAEAAQRLPAGHFRLTVQNHVVRLEWLPTGKHAGGSIHREFTLP